MKVIIKKPRENTPVSRPHNTRMKIGEWARVEAVHSEDNTVDVILSHGLFLTRLSVASKEWVIETEDKDFVSGERDLPPVKARVFVIMPSGTFDDCFVLPISGFPTIYQTKPFLEENREAIKESITPSGWHTTQDHVTGSYETISPDGKTILKIDYGNEESPKEDEAEFHISLFDEVSIDYKMGESLKIEANGNIEVTAENITLNGNDKRFVTYTELDNALQLLVNQIKSHVHNVTTSGSATSQTGMATATTSPISLDISASETQTVKTGG